MRHIQVSALILILSAALGFTYQNCSQTPAGGSPDSAASIKSSLSLVTDRDSYYVGERVIYTLHGPANTPMVWSSSVNGVSTGESRSSYGHFTDASGIFTLQSEPLPNSPGHWRKTVYIGADYISVEFDVKSLPASQNGIYMTVDKPSIYVGDRISFTIQQAMPSTSVLWSSTRDGNPTGENNANYGNVTDSSGYFSVKADPFPDAPGAWVKTVNIGGVIASVSFTVLPANDSGVPIKLQMFHDNGNVKATWDTWNAYFNQDHGSYGEEATQGPEAYFTVNDNRRLDEIDIDIWWQCTQKANCDDAAAAYK